MNFLGIFKFEIKHIQRAMRNRDTNRIPKTLEKISIHEYEYRV